MTDRAGVLSRRSLLAGPALLAPGCVGVSPTAAARLAADGEAATTHLLADIAVAQRRIDAARDLVVLRAALAAPAGIDAETLVARPDVVQADRQLAAAAGVLAQSAQAIGSLREAYRSFAAVAAERKLAAFDARLDQAKEDVDALHTVIDRYAVEFAHVADSVPGAGAVVGVASLVGGLIGRARTAEGLVEPNAVAIALLDGLIAASDREAAMLGPVLAKIAADRGEDVARTLRDVGVARLGATTALETLAGQLGWSVSPLADQQLRDPTASRLVTGLRAVRARRGPPESARLLDPGAARAVLVALRERHVALRDGAEPDPDALRDSLRRLAR